MVAAVEHLTCRLHELVVQKQHELEWLKSHFQFATKHDLEQIEHRLKEKLNTIMATQSDMVAELKVANTQLRKVIEDAAGIQPAMDALTAKIAELEALIAAGGTIGQELVDTVAETKSLAQGVDDKIPERPVVPPPTP